MTAEIAAMSTQYSDVDVYTVGHSNATAASIVQLLLQNEVHVVVDVRSVPYSQYAPQFNRETLARALSHSGIEYVFEGDGLGGRPKDPTCYRDGRLPVGRDDYLQMVDYDEVATRDWYRAGVDRLLHVATERRTAIMCSEEDPLRCHRHHLIAQTLLRMGVVVRHIRASGNVELARLMDPRGSDGEEQEEQLTFLDDLT